MFAFRINFIIRRINITNQHILSFIALGAVCVCSFALCQSAYVNFIYLITFIGVLVIFGADEDSFCLFTLVAVNMPRRFLKTANQNILSFITFIGILVSCIKINGSFRGCSV